MNFPLFLIPIVVGLIAQFSKRFLNKHWKSDIHFGPTRLPRYGGMPSAHTAFAFSLATVIAIAEGVTSASFVIAATLVIFVLDDALRMRIFLERHGEALGKLTAKLPKEAQRDFPHLETRLGHTPQEVFAGALLGIVLTLIIMFFLRVS